MNHRLSPNGSAHLRLLVGVLLLLSLLLVMCSDDDPVSTSPFELMVWPQSVMVSSSAGAPNFDPVHVWVDCDPHQNAVFEFMCESSWMTVSNLGGTTNGITRDSFSISFSVSGLAVGSYCDSVRVTMAGATNSPQYVVVDYTIVPLPTDLSVFPNLMTFSADDFDDLPDPQNLMVGSTDGSHRSYQATETAAWISLTGGDGSTPDTIVVSVDPSDLSTGTHEDTIRLTSEEMSNSPQNVVCRLEIPAWLPQTSPIQDHSLQDVVFVDENNGYAVGMVVDLNSRSGYMIETHDGGVTWEQDPGMFLNAGAAEFYAYSSIDAFDQNVWAVVENGIFYRSIDGGLSWDSTKIELTSPRDSLRGLDFVSAQKGWIVGKSGLVLVSEDGGQSWTEQTSGTGAYLSAVSFADELHGWAIGHGGVVIRTDDGGSNWEVLADPPDNNNLRGVFFLNTSHGFVVGNEGFIARTTDGGDSWETLTSGSERWLYRVVFIDELTGWVAGDFGTVLFTGDGGDTWTPQASGTENGFRSIFFVNETDGWAVGDYGEIRYTTSGGN